jgi:Kef-type K+ transport system membrane component KefB
MILSILDATLPLEDPVLKFLLILLIILLAPILLNKIKIPHLLGLIIAGAVIGPNGFEILERESSITLYGTAGLLYIMFLAGLEIDMGDFKKNSGKSLVFGLYTFIVPMILGTSVGYYILEFNIYTSILLASLFASHTLISYPIASKMGIAKNRAVNITVGGTVITDTLALLVLAVIVGMTTGEVNTEFWVTLSVSIALFAAIVMFIFPLIGRWFFKCFEDSITQYIFVLVMVYIGSVLAEIAGIEAIIGAFLVGLALNRLIPHTSPLMNRIEFVGNAIFIPFFLIGVGMLIDYRVFFEGFETIKVALIISAVATLGKMIAAFFTQKTFRFTKDERQIIFGLSNAQAAATLAAVLVGYNIIIGELPNGEPERLLGETILNGAILMILVTCTISSFATQRAAKKLAIAEADESNKEEGDLTERILIPVSDIDFTEDLVNLSLTIKSKKNRTGLYGLSIVDNTNPEDVTEKQAKKILETAVLSASATDNELTDLLRYDTNIVDGITNVVKEHKITDLVLGLHKSKGISDAFLGKLTNGILDKCNKTTLIYKPSQPLGTIKRHFIVVPEKAEKEIGFPFWLVKMWNIARNTGAKLIFYAGPETIRYINKIHQKHPIECDFKTFTDYEDFLILSREIKKDDNLIIIMSRPNKPSYHQNMEKMPKYLNKYFIENSYILIYPIQEGVDEKYSGIDLKNPSIIEPIEKLDEIGKTLAKLFLKK